MRSCSGGSRDRAGEQRCFPSDTRRSFTLARQHLSFPFPLSEQSRLLLLLKMQISFPFTLPFNSITFPSTFAMFRRGVFPLTTISFSLALSQRINERSRRRRHGTGWGVSGHRWVKLACRVLRWVNGMRHGIRMS